MKILVLGGTQFVGRHIAEELVSAGHTVSVFNRGRTMDELPVGVERLQGNRDEGAAGLAALAGRTWDACVDVSGFTPRQVRASGTQLRGCVGHYAFISAVSVYGDPACGPVDETHPRLPPAEEDVSEITSETYGRLKVTCENIVGELYGDRCACLRPQIVAGPYDPFDRFSYWVRRAGQGGEMLAPGDGSDYVQTIDARDVARFTRIVCERALPGVFNLSGPRLTWADFMSVLGAKNVVWVPAELIRRAGLTEFELPLYRSLAGPRSRLMHVGNDRAVHAGLTLTNSAVTARDVRAWLDDAPLQPALAPQREAELIAAAQAAGNRLHRS